MARILSAGLNLAFDEEATENYAEVRFGPDTLLSAFYGLSHSTFTTWHFIDYRRTSFLRYRNDTQWSYRKLPISANIDAQTAWVQGPRFQKRCIVRAVSYSRRHHVECFKMVFFKQLRLPPNTKTEENQATCRIARKKLWQVCLFQNYTLPRNWWNREKEIVTPPL